MPEKITAGLQATLEQAETEGQPVAEIVEAVEQGAEITTELKGHELTITAHEPENMELAYVTGERRKALVEAVKAFVDATAVYQNDLASPMLSATTRSARAERYLAQ